MTDFHWPTALLTVAAVVSLFGITMLILIVRSHGQRLRAIERHLTHPVSESTELVS